MFSYLFNKHECPLNLFDTKIEPVYQTVIFLALYMMLKIISFEGIKLGFQGMGRPGTKIFPCFVVPLSRDKGRSKNPGTKSLFQKTQKQEWYFVTIIVLTYCEKKLF